MPDFLRTGGYIVFELQPNVNPPNTMVLFLSMTFAASLWPASAVIHVW